MKPVQQGREMAKMETVRLHALAGSQLPGHQRKEGEVDQRPPGLRWTVEKEIIWAGCHSWNKERAAEADKRK